METRLSLKNVRVCAFPTAMEADEFVKIATLQNNVAVGRIVMQKAKLGEFLLLVVDCADAAETSALVSDLEVLRFKAKVAYNRDANLKANPHSRAARQEEAKRRRQLLDQI